MSPDRKVTCSIFREFDSNSEIWEISNVNYCTVRFNYKCCCLNKHSNLISLSGNVCQIVNLGMDHVRWWYISHKSHNWVTFSLCFLLFASSCAGCIFILSIIWVSLIFCGGCIPGYRSASPWFPNELCSRPRALTGKIFGNTQNIYFSGEKQRIYFSDEKYRSMEVYFQLGTTFSVTTGELHERIWCKQDKKGYGISPKWGRKDQTSPQAKCHKLSLLWVFSPSNNIFIKSKFHNLITFIIFILLTMATSVK